MLSGGSCSARLMHGPRCWGSAFCKNKHRKGKRRVPEGEGRRLSSAGFAPPAAEEQSWPSRRFPRTPQEITERRHISTGQIWVLCRAKCDFFFSLCHMQMPSPVSQRKKFTLLHALSARMLAKRMSGRWEVARAGCLSFWRGFIQAVEASCCSSWCWLVFLHVSVLHAGHAVMASLKL